MIELIITVCLTANFQVCEREHDERFLLGDDIKLWQCQLGTYIMGDIVAWQQRHPEWRITKWECRSQKPEKDV